MIFNIEKLGGVFIRKTEDGGFYETTAEVIKVIDNG